MPLSTGSKAKLNSLHPRLAAACLKMSEMADVAGISFSVTQAPRTMSEQDALFAQPCDGKDNDGDGLVDEKDEKVTNAKAGYSWHNFGLAFDIVVLDALGKPNWKAADPAYGKLGAIGKSCGLEWGGDWKTFKVLPHYQLPTTMSLAEARQLFVDGGVSAVWAELDKADATAT